jgi:hypothetical protein
MKDKDGMLQTACMARFVLGRGSEVWCMWLQVGGGGVLVLVHTDPWVGN